MIDRLRRRMTLLFTLFILLVTAGVVVSVSLLNYRSVERRASLTLAAMAGRRGPRAVARAAEGGVPGRRERPDDPGNRQEGGWWQGRRRGPGTAAEDDADASLFNTYTIRTDGEGTVLSWSSPREDLYSDEQIAELARQIFLTGRERGRIGTQFFLLTGADGERTVSVLDARLEMEGVRRVSLIAGAAGALACVLLSAGAFLVIRRMVRPVEEAFRKQRQFVWDASHELKTPLAVISAHAQVLEDELGDNEDLRCIRAEVSRTDSLVRSMLSLARMESGSIRAKREEFDLSRALLSVALPFESTVYEAGKSFVTDIPEGIRVTGDGALLQQLTLILLDNALKYSDAGGEIRLEAARQGKGAVVRVANTGEGISREDLPHIFERFYRADASRNRDTGGSGLGLAIALGIAQACGAKIRAESEPGRTVFTVSLP